MSYVILQDSRLNKGLNLALIDRSKSKSNWWTSDLKNALVFTDKKEAQKQCQKYKYNNPRVVPFDVAKNEVVLIVKTTYKTIGSMFDKNRKNIFQ